MIIISYFDFLKNKIKFIHMSYIFVFDYSFWMSTHIFDVNKKSKNTKTNQRIESNWSSIDYWFYEIDYWWNWSSMKETLAVWIVDDFEFRTKCLFSLTYLTANKNLQTYVNHDYIYKSVQVHKIMNYSR